MTHIKYLAQVIMLFILANQSATCNAAEYALPIKATDPRLEGLLIGHSGGPLEGPNKARNEWSIALYSRLYSTSSNKVLEPLTTEEINNTSALKELFEMPPFIFYSISSKALLKSYTDEQHKKSTYITIQFLHDASEAEIKRQAGNINPAVPAFFKNEKNWNAIVTELNKQRAESFDPDKIKKLTATGAPPEPVAPAPTPARARTPAPTPVAPAPAQTPRTSEPTPVAPTPIAEPAPVIAFPSTYILIPVITKRDPTYYDAIGLNAAPGQEEWALLIYPAPGFWRIFSQITDKPVQWAQENDLLTLLYSKPPVSLYKPLPTTGYTKGINTHLGWETLKAYKDSRTITLQFLHDATPEEIAKKYYEGMKVDPGLFKAMHDETVWENVGSILNRQSAGNSLIKKLTSRKAASEKPIKTQLIQFNADLITLKSKI